jgi:3-hydroxyisobutyrate dehydrogenase-like beta-hydroxyacid dehydrogenase
MLEATEMTTMPAVSFAGIGRMGLPMARNLLRAGFPLTVWNRTEERCVPLIEEGAAVVADAADLANANFVVTMVADAAAARSVLVDSGLLGRLAPGSVVIEMSTIGPTAAAELAEEARSHEVSLLDAPVSGSVTVAESAQLFAMVGGDRAAYDLAAPILDAITKGHVLLGSSGAGAAMKLALNSMIAVTDVSLAETLSLAERFGIDRSDAYDVIAGGALASPFVQYKRPAFLSPETTPTAFTTALMRKDLILAEELAARLDTEIETATAAGRVLDRAIEAGLADEDMASVIQLFERGNGDKAIPSQSATREDS